MFQIGDLVQFKNTKKIGIITDIKVAPAFLPLEKILDVKVLWFGGEEFWCLEFILKVLSSNKN